MSLCWSKMFRGWPCRVRLSSFCAIVFGLSTAGVELVILLTLYLWTVIGSYAFYLEARRNQISTNRYSSLRRALSLLVLEIQNNIMNIC